MSQNPQKEATFADGLLIVLALILAIPNIAYEAWAIATVCRWFLPAGLHPTTANVVGVLFFLSFAKRGLHQPDEKSAMWRLFLYFLSTTFALGSAWVLRLVLGGRS